MVEKRFYERVMNFLFERSESVEEAEDVVGHDFNLSNSIEDMVSKFGGMGIQASNLSYAIAEVHKMLECRRQLEASGEGKCTIFLGLTSNVISCGMRDMIRFLCQHKLVDAVVSSAGGIEEDFIKSIRPAKMGKFEYKGTDLREKHLNRIGNMLVPNNNYCDFQDWVLPHMTTMLEKQKNEGVVWAPSTFIDYLGERIDNEESVYYWCHKNGIPVFNPALTDGSIGDMIFCFSYKEPGLVLDIVRDLRAINDMAVNSTKTGIICFGGGVGKHHISNACAKRGGADFAVYLNTGIEHDGSDGSTTMGEEIASGRVTEACNPVKVWNEFSISGPILLSQGFAKYHQEHHEGCSQCQSS